MKTNLSPEVARQQLDILGRLLYDVSPKTIWERDTATLPWTFRRIRRRCRRFAAEHIAPLSLQADLDPHSFDPHPIFVQAAREGFQTEFMPWPWGTLKLGGFVRSILLAPALKAEEFCAACAGVGLSLLAHELGIAPLFISGDLRAYFKWLRLIYREIKAGEPAVAAFAITEPGAGSDVEDTEGGERARLGCRWRRVPGGFRLNGRKCFISGGAASRWVTFFAAEEGKGLETWTCFLLDKSMPGLSVGRREKKMGQRASDASELVAEDVFAPDERVIGKVGAGWAINRNVLNYSRPVVGAIALGTARGAFERAVQFCKETRLANRALIDYPDVQLALADMMITLSAMRATVWRATRYPFAFQAAGGVAKTFCSDKAWEVCNAAMELLGDHGCLHGQGIEKAARDARLAQIYEGTNQINRLGVFESQLEAEFRRARPPG
jgi:alkylation response protein AidB-like acyl-CoA dehydrogenase